MNMRHDRQIRLRLQQQWKAQSLVFGGFDNVEAMLAMKLAGRYAQEPGECQAKDAGVGLLHALHARDDPHVEEASQLEVLEQVLQPLLEIRY